MMLVVGHVYECDTGRRGLCVQCKHGGCIVAWAENGNEDWRMAIYDRDGKSRSESAPRIIRQVFPT